jgi:hypothetical protein
MSLDLTALTDDELADEITTWAGRVAAGEARLLVLIGEFDDRVAWGGPGMLSCAHWLTWRTGMGPVAARERVRAARRLRELPLTAAAFAEGRLSWTQVRAISRAATPETEASLVDLARRCTGAQLERVCRALRQVHEAERRADEPEAAEDAMRCSERYAADGTLVLTLRVAPQDAPVARAALERMKAEVQAEREASAAELAEQVAVVAPEAPDGLQDASAEAAALWKAGLTREAAVRAEARVRGLEVRPATLGDALVRMASRSLDLPSPAPVPKQRLRLMVDPLSGWARTSTGELLPPMTLTQVMRTLPGRGDAPQLPLEPAPSWTAYDLGRSTRLVSGRLRSLLGQVDGERCRFPGCSRVKKLHAHHVVFWRDGGPTDLANLVLVCSRHHTLIHSKGFQLVLSPDRTLTVRTAADIPVPHAPELQRQSALDLDVDERIDRDTLPPLWDGDRLDLDHVVWAMLHQAA